METIEIGSKTEQAVLNFIPLEECGGFLVVELYFFIGQLIAFDCASLALHFLLICKH